MPRSVLVAKVPCVYDERIVLADPVVNLLRSGGWENWRTLRWVSVGEPKCCKAAT